MCPVHTISYVSRIYHHTYPVHTILNIPYIPSCMSRMYHNIPTTRSMYFVCTDLRAPNIPSHICHVSTIIYIPYIPSCISLTYPLIYAVNTIFYTP
eukprot:jgi/Botrbrau1/20590/Bobra.113_1s0016.1